MTRFPFLLSPVRRSFDLPATILTGLVMALALSGRDLFWAAWIGLVPAMCALYRSGFRRAFVVGAVAGVAQAIGSWYWLPPTTVAMMKSAWPGVVYVLLLSLFYALFFGILFFLVRCLIPLPSRSCCFFHRLGRILAIACLWAGFEYGYAALLMLTKMIFTMSAGHSQWNHPAIIQVASIGGVYAVSFLIVAFNAAVADDCSRRRFALSPWVGGCVALCILGGHLHIQAADNGAGHRQNVSVVVLQGDIPMFESFNEKAAGLIAHRYLELGRMANRDHPDLIVWTETSVPWPLREDDDLVTTMLHVTAPSHACHILGASFHAPGTSNSYYNSLFFIYPNGDITAKYDKRYPLSFVEESPHIPFLSRIVIALMPVRNQIRGTSPPVMDSPFGRIAVMICNENLYSRAVRDGVAMGGEFLVSPGNDFWFRDIAMDDPIDGHFLAALFRAVETRRDMIIANNIGISAIIDSRGRILTRSEKRTQACLSGRITRRNDKSLYVMTGDLFGRLCACIGIMAVIGARISACRSNRADCSRRPRAAPSRVPEDRRSQAAKQRRRNETPGKSRGNE